MTDEDMSRCQAPGHVPQGPGLVGAQERMEGQRLAGSAEVRGRPERLRADEDPLGRPPERRLPPPGHVQQGPDLEGSVPKAPEREPVMRHAEARGEGGAVAAVTVDELDDPGRLNLPG